MITVVTRIQPVNGLGIVDSVDKICRHLAQLLQHLLVLVLLRVHLSRLLLVPLSPVGRLLK